MTKTVLHFLNEIASLLKVQVGKITINNDSLLPTRVLNDKSTIGCLNIILTLLAESKSDLCGSDLLEQSEIRQWLEYGLLYALHCNLPHNIKQVLTELNGVLATKTYLVSQRLTIADVFLYYILMNTMGTLTNIEKEKFIHVSRWFDNLQQNSTLRQSHKLINFSTNYLFTSVSARH